MGAADHDRKTLRNLARPVETETGSERNIGGLAVSRAQPEPGRLWRALRTWQLGAARHFKPALKRPQGLYSKD
jgi:hypothetical protein